MDGPLEMFVGLFRQKWVLGELGSGGFIFHYGVTFSQRTYSDYWYIDGTFCQWGHAGRSNSGVALLIGVGFGGFVFSLSTELAFCQM